MVTKFSTIWQVTVKYCTTLQVIKTNANDLKYCGIYFRTIPQTIGEVLQKSMAQSGAAGSRPNPIDSLVAVSVLPTLKARNLKIIVKYKFS